MSFSAVGASESLEFKVDLATSGDPLEDKEVCVQSAIVNSNVDCELKDAEVKVEKNNHEDDCRGHGDVVSLDQRASVVEEKKADDMQLDADDAILESESVNAVVNAAECNSKVDQGSLTEGKLFPVVLTRLPQSMMNHRTEITECSCELLACNEMLFHVCLHLQFETNLCHYHVAEFCFQLVKLASNLKYLWG